MMTYESENSRKFKNRSNDTGNVSNESLNNNTVLDKGRLDRIRNNDITEDCKASWLKTRRSERKSHIRMTHKNCAWHVYFN